MRIETYEAHAGADFSLVFNRLGEDGYQDTLSGGPHPVAAVYIFYLMMQLFLAIAWLLPGLLEKKGVALTS